GGERRPTGRRGAGTATAGRAATTGGRAGRGSECRVVGGDVATDRSTAGGAAADERPPRRTTEQPCRLCAADSTAEPDGPGPAGTTGRLAGGAATDRRPLNHITSLARCAGDRPFFSTQGGIR